MPTLLSKIDNTNIKVVHAFVDFCKLVNIVGLKATVFEKVHDTKGKNVGLNANSAFHIISS